jgi:hypothetical protein
MSIDREMVRMNCNYYEYILLKLWVSRGFVIGKMMPVGSPQWNCCYESCYYYCCCCCCYCGCFDCCYCLLPDLKSDDIVVVIIMMMKVDVVVVRSRDLGSVIVNMVITKYDDCGFYCDQSDVYKASLERLMMLYKKY